MTLLIGQLEDLIEERKRAGHGGITSDAANTSRCAPCNALAVVPLASRAAAFSRQRAVLVRDLIRQRHG